MDADVGVPTCMRLLFMQGGNSTAKLSLPLADSTKTAGNPAAAAGEVPVGQKMNVEGLASH
jgi:hypothetical protein